MKKSAGFSLISTMIGSLIVVIIMGSFVKFSLELQKLQFSLKNRFDRSQFELLVQKILYDEKHCKISIAGEGPFTGVPTTPIINKKSQIDGDGDAGLNIELFYSNVNGDLRKKKIFSTTDTNYNRFASYLIKNIKLYLNNGTGDYIGPILSHYDTAAVKITINDTSKSNSSDEELTYFVNLELSTDSANNTSIIACTRKGLSNMPQTAGCSRKNEWYCHCNEATGNLGMNVTTCFYCNSLGQIDKVSSGKIDFSLSSVNCVPTSSFTTDNSKPSDYTIN